MYCNVVRSHGAAGYFLSPLRGGEKDAEVYEVCGLKRWTTLAAEETRMGLDACVYCDCFERGLLRTPPQPVWGVFLNEDGARMPATSNLDEQMAFDAWDQAACAHEGGVALHHRLGNGALIGLFRELLRAHADRLSILFAKVIYSGVHAGDFLGLGDVERLGAEVSLLAEVRVDERRNERFLRHFEGQLRELVACSLSLRKPISF